MSISENGHFPPNRTLIINGLGRGADLAIEDFTRMLVKTCSAHEVLGINSPSGEPYRLARLSGRIQPDLFPFVKNLLTPEPARPRVEWTPQATFIKKYQDQSRQEGFPGRTMFHFLDYNPRTVKQVKESITQATDALPDLFHLAVIPAACRTKNERAFYDQASQIVPPDSLGIPVLLADQGGSRLRGYSESDAIFLGLAGLISNHKHFPLENRLNYQEILEVLSAQSNIVGVGLEVIRTPLKRFSFRPATDILLVDDVARAINNSLTDANRRTKALPKDEDYTQMLVIQLPFHFSSGFWKREELIEQLNPETGFRVGRQSVDLPKGVIHSYGAIDGEQPDADRTVPIVATRLYSAQ